MSSQPIAIRGQGGASLFERLVARLASDKAANSIIRYGKRPRDYLPFFPFGQGNRLVLCKGRKRVSLHHSDNSVSLFEGFFFDFYQLHHAAKQGNDLTSDLTAIIMDLAIDRSLFILIARITLPLRRCVGFF